MADVPEVSRRRLHTNPDGSSRNGRAPLLTPEIQKGIVDLVTAGNFPQVAAQYHGISERAYFEWMARGENPDHPRNLASGEDTTIYAQFAQAVREAEARAQVVAVLTVVQAARKGEPAAMRFLERRYRRLWGAMVQLAGEGGGPMRVEGIGSVLDDHEKQVLRDIILEELERRKEKVEA